MVDADYPARNDVQHSVNIGERRPITRHYRCTAGQHPIDHVQRVTSIRTRRSDKSLRVVSAAVYRSSIGQLEASFGQHLYSRIQLGTNPSFLLRRYSQHRINPASQALDSNERSSVSVQPVIDTVQGSSND